MPFYLQKLFSVELNRFRADFSLERFVEVTIRFVREITQMGLYYLAPAT